MLRGNPGHNRLTGCGGIGYRGWTPAFAGVTNGAWAPWPEYNRHPGLEPLLSGLDLGDRALGLDSTGFRRVRRDRDSDRHPASRPCSRHTRTCSGYLFEAARPGGRMDTRNKSGYDEKGAFGHDGQKADRRRRAPPKTRPRPARLRPTAKPDSNGLVPGSIFRPSRQPAPVEDGPRLSRSGAKTCGGRA